MAVYNLHYTKGMSLNQSIFFYENISSAIERDSLIDSGTEGSASNKTIVMYIRGRKTNWIRSVCAIGTVSNGTFRPTYKHNERYWELKMNFAYPGTIAGALDFQYDVMSSRTLGTFQGPVNETYDITLFYSSLELGNDAAISSGSVIPGINIVLNVTEDETFDYINTNSPNSYYTEYSKNDLTAKLTADSANSPIGTGGLPLLTSGSSTIDIHTDVQYGTQTWDPTA
tara:strand:+ start:386 stop:1066 length:681 start_codon:yes stop_codon:yes gene_type:complete